MQRVLRTTRLALMASALAGMFGANPPVSEAAPTLTKEPGAVGVYGTHVIESTPILYQGQQILFQSHRGEGWLRSKTWLLLRDVTTGVESPFLFGHGFSLGCAYVNGDQINVFASKLAHDGWQGFEDIYRFTSTDGIYWSAPTLAVPRSGSEHLLNSSVCQDKPGQGYLMAYETSEPLEFIFKFARSTDLATWQKLDVPAFAGPNGNEYSACPVIRYCDPYYYVIYLHDIPNPGHNGYVSNIARSKDLTTWEYGENPVLEAGIGNTWDEGINNSDVDLIEIGGKTYVYYADGDQATWGDLRRAVYDGPMSQFFESYFPEPVPEPASCILLGTAMLAPFGYAWWKRKRGRGALNLEAYNEIGELQCVDSEHFEWPSRWSSCWWSSRSSAY